MHVSQINPSANIETTSLLLNIKSYHSVASSVNPIDKRIS